MATTEKASEHFLLLLKKIKYLIHKMYLYSITINNQSYNEKQYSSFRLGIVSSSAVVFILYSEYSVNSTVQKYKLHAQYVVPLSHRVPLEKDLRPLASTSLL